MGNAAQLLEKSLSNLLSNQSKIKELSDYGLLAEYKRLYIAVKYINENSIVPSNARVLDALSSAIDDYSIDSSEFKLATSCAELAILEGMRASIYAVDKLAGDSRKEIKEIEKKKKEIISVAGEILPDALNRVYDILQDYGRDGRIYDSEARLVFNFDSFIDKINKSAHSTSVINNLPTLSTDATIKYRRVVKESAKEFLNLIPSIGRTLSTVVDEGVRRPTIMVNTDVRKLRRANRPEDKNGNLLPSYLDYIRDDGTIVPYNQFLNTPTAKLLKEFKNEREYAHYVSSTAFWAYVSYLETPMSDEAVEVGLPSFSLNELPISGGVDPFDTRRYAQEKLILPKEVYKDAKKSGNLTTQVTKLRNDKILNGAKRAFAGVLSVVVLANSIGWPVSQIYNSIKDSSIGPNDEPNPPQTDDPVTPPEETTPMDNVDVVTPDEIVDNPAEEITPPEETTGPEENITPPETDVVNPGETTTPEENTETPLPGHNNIDDDRREEGTDDSFWFE